MNDLRPGAINADPREHGKSVQLCHRLLRSLIARGLSLPALVEAVERIKKDTRLKDTVKDAPKMNTPTDWLNELAATLNESQVKRGRANKEYRVFEDSRDGFIYVAPHGPRRRTAHPAAWMRPTPAPRSTSSSAPTAPPRSTTRGTPARPSFTG